MQLGIIEKKGKMPLGFTSIQEWIDGRKKFTCARDLRQFLESIGIRNNADLIDITHCVSLSDTFWVKRVDSNLKWRDVSPFRNNYSKVISTYALDGIKIGINEKNYFSPVISTDGTFPHTWKFSTNGIKFIKAGSKYTLGGINSGREPYSEYYASEVAEYLGFEHVEYKIRYHSRSDGNIDVVTECDCYNSEDIGAVTASKLGLTSYEDVLEYCRRISKEEFDKCLDMYFLDCLLLNTDRHFGNIEFRFDTSTLEIKGLVPIFDNNYALLPRFIEGLEEFNREDYKARDGRSFEELFKLVIKNKSYRRELIRLKNFKFSKPRTVKISDERLNFLNDLLQKQVEHLLKEM